MDDNKWTTADIRIRNYPDTCSNNIMKLISNIFIFVYVGGPHSV